MSRSFILALISSMKSRSSSLSFWIDWMIISVFLSLMPTRMMRGMWSEGFQMSGANMFRPNHGSFGFRNVRSRTEFASRRLSANLVGPGLEGGDRSRPKLSAKVISSVVWVWWR